MLEINTLVDVQFLKTKANNHRNMTVTKNWGGPSSSMETDHFRGVQNFLNENMDLGIQNMSEMEIAQCIQH